MHEKAAWVEDSHRVQGWLQQRNSILLALGKVPVPPLPCLSPLLGHEHLLSATYADFPNV